MEEKQQFLDNEGLTQYHVNITKTIKKKPDADGGDVSDTVVKFAEATARSDIASGEKLSMILGKIKKWFTDLKPVAFSGNYSDLSEKPAIPKTAHSTSAATAIAKTASTPDGDFELIDGAMVLVTFQNIDTTDSNQKTLNIDGLGAKYIRYDSVDTFTYSLSSTVLFMYHASDDAYYIIDAYVREQIEFMKNDISSIPRTATITVAAANSNRAAADYVCTGTNDQTTINSAIAALPSTGGKIVLLEGTYNCSGVISVNKANVTIEGMGRGSTVLDFGGLSGYTVNVTASNFILRGAAVRNGTVGIYLNGNITNCTVEDVEVSGFDWAINATYKDGWTHHTIRNVYAHDNQLGIHINTKGCLVTGCICKDNNEAGINVEGSYNKFYNNYVIRGTGQTSDYTSSQYTIRIKSTGQYNDVSDNYILGKNYTNNGGSTNTFNNNRYE